MARRRLRDWPLIVYRYWCAPRGPLPAGMWRTARAMQALWNSLVESHALVRRELEGQDRAERRARWRAWQAEARELVARSGLDWEQGPAVLDRFTVACREAPLRRRNGIPSWPVAHRRLDRIAIPHRFTGGGVPVERLFSRRAERVRLLRPPDGAYASGARRSRYQRAMPPHAEGLRDEERAWNVFRIGGEAIRFRCVLHRLPPPSAIVKQVVWLGRRDPLGRWSWAIAVTAEEPPPIRAEPAGAREACGLDLGWRVMGDYLRIGYLVDGETGQGIELRLPFNAQTSHTRRHRLRADWRDLAVMDEGMARYLDATKAACLPLLPPPASLPEEAAGIVRSWTRVRQAGLVRLLRALEVGGGHDALVALLRRWRIDNDRARSMRHALWTRLVGRRRWYYENLAAWICRTWRTVVWEGDLGVKAMAEEQDAEPALKAAQRYRQIAAIGDFRLRYRRAAAKAGTMLVDKPAAYTTLTCWVCGEVLAGQDGSLWLRCPAGHRWDQDDNAARVLLSQIGALRTRPMELRTGEGSGMAQPLEIPAELRAVAVTVRPG